MKSFFFIVIPCLLLATGRDLAAQNKQGSPPKDVYEAFQNIEAPMMTEDGNWLVLRKRSWMPAWNKSDLDKDTVILFNLAGPGKTKTAGYRLNIRDMAFVGNSHMLLSGGLQTELLNLNEQTSTYFKGAKSIQAVKNKNQFVLLYSPEEKNRLELHAGNGDLLNAADQVTRFYTTEKGSVYAVTENENQEYEIVLINDTEKEKVYGSSRKILSLDIDPGERGMIICEQSPISNCREALYLDLETKISYPLKEVLPVAFQRCFSESISDDSTYFLKLWIGKEKKDTSVVDIWYGNDNRLEEKFSPPVGVVSYVWEPRNHFIRQVGSEHLPVGINIGSAHYFLCFDPDSLQDYRSEQAPLLLYVYELEADRYSLLDTIAPEMYLSGDGNYALSPSGSGWNLYHIPSGSKKLIGSKGTGTPWFTTDGKAVIFEGEGAVWQYDIKTATLTPLVTFDRYQTRIVNGQWKGMNAGKGTFAAQQVNPSEPLLIELYDPSENRTGYSLWHEGNAEPIVPPTNRYIQSLNYNRSFTRFSWLEEDYNLPPQLVYKQMGKEKVTLYKSNRQDKAIESLKQDIVSYANSDNVPMKGVLYYPLNYNSSLKYPMVLYIYEKQNQLSNRYPYPSYYESLGFNIRLFLENGYFVYLPDIVIQGKAGPGQDALDCVNHALDALARNPLIDKSRIGLIGHSFGGYETDYIATRSTRFAAFVSGSGHSDIVWDANCFNYNFFTPDYVRIEANIYKLGKPFSADKSLYFMNNPVWHAEKVNAPLLLWAGLEDKNVTADQTMAFYNALRCNGKDVVALFYKGEGHCLQQQQNQADLTGRILDWFDYFLKDQTEVGWITKWRKEDAR